MSITCTKCGATGVNVAHVRECYAVTEEPLGGSVVQVVPKTGPIPQEERMYLSVPFAEKEQAKELLSARWDPERKAWYCHRDAELSQVPEGWLGQGKASRSRQAAEDGFYRKDNEVYKVLKAVHGSGLPYAKRLIPTIHPPGHELSGHPKGDWEKATGMQFELLPEHLLSYSEACRLGKLYGFCIRCGATLTKESSIERGMGDWCAGKMEGGE